MRLEANESIYRHCEITQQWFCCWIAIYCLFVFFFICSRFPRKIELTGRGNEVETLPKITDKWWIICSFAILLKRSGISLEKKKVNVPWVLKWIDWAAGARRPLPGGRDATAVTRGPWRGGRDAGALTRGPGRGVRGAKSRDAWAGARGPGRGGRDAGAPTRGPERGGPGAGAEWSGARHFHRHFQGRLGEIGSGGGGGGGGGSGPRWCQPTMMSITLQCAAGCMRACQHTC